MEYDRIYRIDMLREVIVTDTLGFVSVKDSLFANSSDYKNMASIPIKGVESLFSLKADVIDKNGYNVPVFEVRVSKDVILFDQNKDLLNQEKETVSVDGVNGPDLVLGSLTDVSTSGNCQPPSMSKQNKSIKVYLDIVLSSTFVCLQLKDFDSGNIFLRERLDYEKVSILLYC